MHSLIKDRAWYKMCSQVHGYSFCSCYYCRMLMILKQNAFRSATDVMSNYLNQWTDTVFFSVRCVVTHSVVCTLRI